MLENASAAEKIGLIGTALGLIGGAILACTRILQRFWALELAVAQAKEERKELLDEVKGLRRDIHEFMLAVLERDK